jgi:hypothetical protein
MKTTKAAWVLLAAALVLAGCSKSPTEPDQGALTSAEIDQIKQSIEDDPLFTSDGTVLDDGEDPSFDTGVLGKSATPILPRGWTRKITDVERSVEVERLNDTTALATVVHTFTGQIRIAAKYSLQDTAFTIVTKNFVQTTSRKIKFFKNVLDRWVPREVTAAKGGTQGSQIRIDRVDVLMGADSISITDPNEYFLRLPRFGGREIPEFGQSTPMKVRVVVTSTASDTDFVSLHRPWLMMGPGVFRPLHVRMSLVSQTQIGSSFERVYELSWNAHVSGRHHVFVEAVTRESLFDDAAPFSSQMWGVPYIVQ